jgi:hypothetical protein
MSKIKLESNSSGAGTFTIASPNSSTDRTLTLPDGTGTLNISGVANEVPAGTSSDPAIYTTGDSNTGIFFPTADTIGVATGGVERVRIDSTGIVSVGDATPPTNSLPLNMLISTDTAAGTNLTIRRSFTGTNNPSISLVKSRGTAASPTIVASGDGVGSLVAAGYDGTNYIQAARIQAFVDGTPDTNDMPGRLVFSTTADGAASVTERMRIASNGNAYVGTTSFLASSSTDTGILLSPTGTVFAARSGNVSASFGRQTSDGNIVQFVQAGTTEGSISVAGAVVSYNAFAGSHWSQLLDESKPDILRGTVVETIDEMCEWPGEDNPRLPKFKISDIVASPRVYGVFMQWDNDDSRTNDAYITGLGAYLIRMAPGSAVNGGDLVESNGDGCARVQSDAYLKSSTIAKITSPAVTDTYEDGSFTVPCVLYCR